MALCEPLPFSYNRQGVGPSHYQDEWSPSLWHPGYAQRSRMGGTAGS